VCNRTGSFPNDIGASSRKLVVSAELDKSDTCKHRDLLPIKLPNYY
jgi:hypothetical protein